MTSQTLELICDEWPQGSNVALTPDSRPAAKLDASSRAVALIRSYQRLAPTGVRGSCRFTPTCSVYAIVSIETYGLVRGLSRALRRILRCRPPNGGIDEP